MPKPAPKATVPLATAPVPAAAPGGVAPVAAPPKKAAMPAAAMVADLGEEPEAPTESAGGMEKWLAIAATLVALLAAISTFMAYSAVN
jgi:hypothetical protein